MTTMLPLSTLSSLLAGQSNVKRLTAQAQQAGQELSTGLRANVYVDLGQAAAIPLALRGQMDQVAAFSSANTLLGDKMNTMSTALGTVHDTAQSVLTTAVGALSYQTGATSIQASARAALDTITAALNTNVGGEYLFSGTATDTPPLTGWTTASPTTGTSPADAVASIVGSGPTDAASATSTIAALDAAFSSTSSTPTQNYQGTFYNGTPSGGGQQTALIGQGQVLSYGVKAGDPAIRNVIEGLSMLASTDPSTMSASAYQTWMQGAVSKLSDGVGGVTSAQATLGAQQAQVADMAQKQSDMKDVLNSRILGYESVDTYDAASRLQTLQTQLQATYQATAQLGSLSILNYL